MNSPESPSEHLSSCKYWRMILPVGAYSDSDAIASQVWLWLASLSHCLVSLGSSVSYTPSVRPDLSHNTWFCQNIKKTHSPHFGIGFTTFALTDTTCNFSPREQFFTHKDLVFTWLPITVTLAILWKNPIRNFSWS